MHREGSFTRSGLEEVDEIEVFKGDENKVRAFLLLLKIENLRLFHLLQFISESKMLENRPVDALGSLVLIALAVSTVSIVLTVFTELTAYLKREKSMCYRPSTSSQEMLANLKR